VANGEKKMEQAKLAPGEEEKGWESLFWRDRVAQSWGLPEVPPHGLSPTGAFADFVLEIHGGSVYVYAV